MDAKEGKPSKLAQMKENIFPADKAEISPCISKQIHKNILMFIAGGLLLLLFLIVVKAWEFVYMAVGIVLFGVYISLYLYHMAVTGKMVEVEGVIIEKERTGYRKQKLYLYIQTSKHAVYRILATELGMKYKEGNIIRFYSNEDSLNNLQDGVYIVNTVYASERLSAKITSDDEDEEIDQIDRDEQNN